MSDTSIERPSQAERIIGKFGGLGALARALGHKHPTTVQGWKERGFIPPRHHDHIFDTARELGIDLKPEDFLTLRSVAE